MKKIASLLALAAAITIGAVYYFTRPPAQISTPPLAALPLEMNPPTGGTATHSNRTEMSPTSAPTEAAASAAPPKPPPGEVRQEFARRVAQAWAAVDPGGATTWAASLSDSEERKSTLTDVALQIAQTDPASAVGLAERLDFGGRNGTLENLAQLWADKDLAAALDWATQQPAGGQRDQIIARMAFVQAHTAPEDAVNLVVDQIPPGPAQDEAAMSVLNQWGMQDYPEALDWVNQFQEGPLRDRALKELAGIAQYRQGMNQIK